MTQDIFIGLAGVIVGVMNAIAGGGMLIGFPALIAAGIPPLSANATGYVAVLPGQLTSAFGYRSYLRKVPLYYAWLLVPCMAGAGVGSLILRHTSSRHFGSLVPWLILLAVTLFAVQPLLRARLHHHIQHRIRRTSSLLKFSAILFPLAMYGGYFGPGFGFVLLAFLSFTKLNHLHQMNGLKNIAAVGMAIASILVLAPGPFINWRAGIIMAIGSTVGGYGGTYLARRVPSRFIRLVVVAIGIAAAGYLAVRQY